MIDADRKGRDAEEEEGVLAIPGCGQNVGDFDGGGRLLLLDAAAEELRE